MYDYREAMKNDVLQAIKENYTLTDYANREELEEKLNDDLWIDDSVTGNGSGSYTMNRDQAKEYVVDNMDLVCKMASEFAESNESLGKHFYNQDWEYFDVSIRCYLLGQAISDALNDLYDD